MILSLRNICKSFGINEILKDITFTMEAGDKLAIVGVNGAGKTTLIRIITGELQMDSGDMALPGDTTLGYMSQMLDLDEDSTVETELYSVFKELIAMESRIELLSQEIAKSSGEEQQSLMARYGKLNEEFEQKNGYEYKSRVRGVMNGLGFRDMAKMAVKLLSGGQKTRVCLGKLLLSAPDILLLDEPTNHLDIESIQWLEDFLKGYPKSVIIISHDRYFLDKTVTRIVEIENKKAKVYNGNYTFYAKKKETDRQIALKHYIDQQKIIKKQEESIKLLKSFNREKSIKRAASKEKQLGKMNRVDRPDSLPDKIHIELSPKVKSGDEVLHITDLKKCFDSHLLFENVSFSISRGEKIALIGPNGIGKTTLFKILMGQMEYNGGEYKQGHNVVIGYYDQYQQALNDNKTIFDEISDAYPAMTAGEIRNVLAAFVFTGDDVFKKIASLSGGEKGRVSLAKIMLSGANFLLLDEPTNHLDMYSKEILEEALQGYTGTVLYISHDRYFINSTADRILELDKNGVVQYLGNYDYYLEKKAHLPVEESAAAGKPSGNKEEWARKKEEEAKSRKFKNRQKNLRIEIEATEKQIDLLSARLSSAEVATDHALAAQIYGEHEQLEEKLLALYEEIETLENNLE